ncbi:GNAT family N-acetyltransferase [Caldithrix abyssi]|nr:GNAT family N-acetyltransferase [Caldithrix abyssi]
MPNIQTREATVEDSSLILQFVEELATYERAASEVTATVEDIQKSIFSAESTVHALVCSINEEPVGFAVYFYNYSTWLGKKGLYLEDLYVSPKYRGTGAGKTLLRHLAKIAVSKDCGRFEWSVLDWNEPAMKFYESLGAKPQSEWVIYRLAGEALRDFAKG